MAEISPRNPLSGARSEAISLPLFAGLAALLRAIARPLLLRWWRFRVRRYSFARAEREIFARLPDAVERSGEHPRAKMGRSFRRRMAATSTQ